MPHDRQPFLSRFGPYGVAVGPAWILGRRSTTWQDGGAFVKADQYYSDQGPVAFFNGADNITHFEHGDWLGTERLRTDNTGSANVSTFSSLPFGEPNLTTGNDLDGAHFTGMDEDGAFSASSLGLHHATFREYNSNLGRWMSPDPYYGSYDPTNPQSLNRYSYASNNPLARTDPSGLDGNDCGDDYGYDGTGSSGGGGAAGGAGGGGFYSSSTYLDDMGNVCTGVGLESSTSVTCDLSDAPGLSSNSGTSYGSSSSGGGAVPGSANVFNPLVAPNNLTKSQIQQQCVDGFNASALGKLINFFSPLSALLGPDRLSSAVETYGGGAVKFGAVEAGLAAKQSVITTLSGSASIASPLNILAGKAAELTELVAKRFGGPTVAAAAGLQVLAHAACDTTARQQTGQIVAPPGLYSTF